MNLNKVFIIGRMVRDPELKTLPAGTSVAKFSVATNHVYTDKSGAKQETAQFHNCVVFGRLAETVSQFLQKGQEVMIEGRIQTNSWDKKDGTKGYMTEIICERVQFGQRAKPKDAPADAGAPGVDEGEVKTEDIQF